MPGLWAVHGPEQHDPMARLMSGLMEFDLERNQTAKTYAGHDLTVWALI